MACWVDARRSSRFGDRVQVTDKAPGGSPCPEEAAASTCRPQSSAALAADGDQSRVGVRFRFRYVRRRAHAEMPDGHRRVHPGVLGDRRRWRHSIRTHHRGADAARQRPWRPALPALLDNGPEFVARAILRWLQTAQIETAFIDPGKPWQNAPTNRLTGSCARSLEYVSERLERERTRWACALCGTALPSFEAPRGGRRLCKDYFTVSGVRRPGS